MGYSPANSFQDRAGFNYHVEIKDGPRFVVWDEQEERQVLDLHWDQFLVLAGIVYEARTLIEPDFLEDYPTIQGLEERIAFLTARRDELQAAGTEKFLALQALKIENRQLKVALAQSGDLMKMIQSGFDMATDTLLAVSARDIIREGSGRVRTL